MKELAKKYRRSAAALNKRIRELTAARDELAAASKDPDKDPDIIELNDRLKPLRNMLWDLCEVTKEVEHYYDRWWWRSETLTCNQRKSRKFIYAGPTRY